MYVKICDISPEVLVVAEFPKCINKDSQQKEAGAGMGKTHFWERTGTGKISTHLSVKSLSLNIDDM